jgi:hypothetical protein
MNLIKVILILSFCFILFNSESQVLVMPDRMVIAGFVFDSDSEEALPYVNVYVKKTRRGTITDTTGFFVLFARTGDTIIFSSVAHHKLYIEAHDSIGDVKEPAMVYLQPRIYELASVDVIALKRYQQFKYDFIRLKLPDDAYVFADRNFATLPSELAYYSRQGTEGFGLVMHPISALYDMFSKEGRQRRKLEEFEAQDSFYEKVESRYNPEIVSNITGLSNEKAKDFMKWCNFNEYLILSLSDYQFIELIVKQYGKYATQNN